MGKKSEKMISFKKLYIQKLKTNIKNWCQTYSKTQKHGIETPSFLTIDHWLDQDYLETQKHGLETPLLMGPIGSSF